MNFYIFSLLIFVNMINEVTRKARMESMEARRVRSMTCYICLENIVTMNRKFGLQNNCDHFFCFDCLLTWRRTVCF